MNNTCYEWDIPLDNIAYDEGYMRGFEAYCAEVFAEGALNSEHDIDVGYGYTAKQHYYEKHITDISVKTAQSGSLSVPTENVSSVIMPLTVHCIRSSKLTESCIISITITCTDIMCCGCRT